MRAGARRRLAPVLLALLLSCAEGEPGTARGEEPAGERPPPPGAPAPDPLPALGPEDLRRLAAAIVRDLQAPPRAWSPAQEREEGRRVLAEALARHPGTVGGALAGYVAMVGGALVRATTALGSDRYAWVFHLLDAPHVALQTGPGGYVLLTRGALASCRDEDELAALLAHGMATVLGRHGLRWLDVRHPLVPAPASAGSGGGDPPADPREAALEPHLEAARADRAARLDRELLLAADRDALRLLADAGYDPQALRTWLLCRPRVVGAPTNLERADALAPALAALAAPPGDAAAHAARRARFERALADAGVAVEGAAAEAAPALTPR